MRLCRGAAILASLALPGLGVFAAHADSADAHQLAKAALGAMSIEDKVGQVLMITLGAGARLTPSARRFLADVRPGGITLFRYHLRRLRAVPAFASALRASVPAAAPFIAVDQEGGKVSRLGAGVPRVPSNPELGSRKSPELAERTGRSVAEAMRRLGFDLNLAPVLDLPRALGGRDVPRRTGGRHLVGRALGANPLDVAQLGDAYVRGLQAGGVGAVAKHFPGEGASRGDPHRGLPTSPVSLAELEAVDLVPFRGLRSDAVMTSHVHFPALGAGPASLLPATYKSLREGVRFEGVAMTDGLEMKSIRQRYGLGRAAVMALRAGADMVSIFWSPAKVLQARAAVLDALRKGELTAARLDEAVLRILRVKLRRGARVGPAMTAASTAP